MQQVSGLMFEKEEELYYVFQFISLNNILIIIFFIISFNLSYSFYLFSYVLALLPLVYLRSSHASLKSVRSRLLVRGGYESPQLDCISNVRIAFNLVLLFVGCSRLDNLK